MRRMTAKELLEQKEAFTVDDICILINVKKGRAYKFIREVKAYSDRLQVNGRILKKDYLEYVNREV